MRIHPTIAVALAVLASAGWLVARPDAAARLADRYMRAQAVAMLFSGAVLIGRRDEIVFAKGYGYSDVEREIPNEPETQYRIGSITKPFTAILTLQLQQEGALSVTDPICAHLTPCPDHWAPITIHHLLSHTSGIFNFTNSAEYAELTELLAGRDEVIATFRDRALGFAPGARFEYSNSNYHLLGAIIENVTGRPYAQVLAERITVPLGLAATGFGSRDPASTRFAVGYRPDDDDVLMPDRGVDVAWSFAAGGMYSTVEDLFRWSRALDGDELLPAGFRHLMWTPVTDTYGYGWVIRGPSPETLDRRVEMHSGRIQGYTGCFIRFPSEDLTVVVLSNSVMADTCTPARDLAAITLGEPFTMPIARRAIRLAPEVLERYVGSYRFDARTTITIRRNGDRLFAQVGNSPARSGCSYSLKRRPSSS